MAPQSSVHINLKTCILSVNIAGIEKSERSKVFNQQQTIELVFVFQLTKISFTHTHTYEIGIERKSFFFTFYYVIMCTFFFKDYALLNMFVKYLL